MKKKIIFVLFQFRFKIIAKLANTFISHKYQNNILDVGESKSEMQALDIKGILGTVKIYTPIFRFFINLKNIIIFVPQMELLQFMI